MTRDLTQLADEQFDVLVVGGGAAGAATAREAALRGLRTALVEKGDFGAGASAHCFKMVHGGIRYLQHADIPRLRYSSRERAAMLRIAPHLVAPLPIAIPTYGHGRSGKPFLGTGMLVYDGLTLGRNRQLRDPSRRIPPTQFMSKREVLEHFPTLDPKGLTGAAVFRDGQMYSAPRLVWAFVQGAQAAGAAVANYAGMESLLRRDGRIVGATVRDADSGSVFDIRARVIINAAGPWAESVIAAGGLPTDKYRGAYSRDACFVVDRRFESPLAVAIQGRSRDADVLLGRGARHLFLVPWRDTTLVGVWHRVVPRDPDRVGLTDEELQGFITEMNASFPALALQLSDVLLTGFGLVPFGEEARQAPGTFSFGKESRLIDHRVTDGLTGLVTLISVRYTVARSDAVQAVDLACDQLDRPHGAIAGDSTPLPGGDIDDFERLLRDARDRAPRWLPAVGVEPLLRNYGTRYDHILSLAEQDPRLSGCVPGSYVSFAELAHAIRAEMAQHLTDVIFRRTDLGTARHPGESAVAVVAEFMQRELGWTNARLAGELAEVDAYCTRYRVRPRT